MLVTSKLGLWFIWIDALCIIQDSDADKDKEIHQTSDIYSQALVTIAAGNSRASTLGFLKPPNYIHDSQPNSPYYNIPFAGGGEVQLYPKSFGEMCRDLSAA